VFPFVGPFLEGFSEFFPIPELRSSPVFFLDSGSTPCLFSPLFDGGNACFFHVPPFPHANLGFGTYVYAGAGCESTAFPSCSAVGCLSSSPHACFTPRQTSFVRSTEAPRLRLCSAFESFSSGVIMLVDFWMCFFFVFPVQQHRWLPLGSHPFAVQYVSMPVLNSHSQSVPTGVSRPRSVLQFLFSGRPLSLVIIFLLS